MVLVLTNSYYWFKKWCKIRGVVLEEAKYVRTKYELEGYDRSTRVVMTNGCNRLDLDVIQAARQRFDKVTLDLV